MAMPAEPRGENKIEVLVGWRFAHQRFADSRESIRTKKTIFFEALGQIRANRVFPPIRILIRVNRAQSSLLSIFCFWKVDSQKEGFFEARIDSRESAHKERIFVQILGGEELLEKCRREIFKRRERGSKCFRHVSDRFSDPFCRIFQTICRIDFKCFRRQFCSAGLPP